MKASTWKAGDLFGIRVGKENAEKYFKKEWSDVEIKIDDKFHRFKLKPIFWTTCPEFRGEIIKKWLQARQMLECEKNRTYELELMPIKNKRFELLEPSGKTSTRGYCISIKF